MIVTVKHSMGDLESDFRKIATSAPKGFAVAVQGTAEQGNRIAKEFARESAGAHGKHYHKAFSAEAITPHRWEYGPDSAKPQGGMSFEGGSRNQKPHLDLARSTDVVRVRFPAAVEQVLDRLFWPST